VIARVRYPTLVLILSLSARLLIAAVFAIAGLAKFRQRAAFQQTLIAFAAPVALTPALAVALPSLELIIAAALLPTRTASFAARGAVLLLVLFTLVIARTLLPRDPEPEAAVATSDGGLRLRYWVAGRTHKGGRLNVLPTRMVGQPFHLI